MDGWIRNHYCYQVNSLASPLNVSSKRKTLNAIINKRYSPIDKIMVIRIISAFYAKLSQNDSVRN